MLLSRIWIQAIGAKLDAGKILMMLFVEFPVGCLAVFAAIVPSVQESAS
jgi:hypothetical protein